MPFLFFSFASFSLDHSPSCSHQNESFCFFCPFFTILCVDVAPLHYTFTIALRVIVAVVVDEHTDTSFVNFLARAYSGKGIVLKLINVNVRYAQIYLSSMLSRTSVAPSTGPFVRSRSGHHRSRRGDLLCPLPRLRRVINKLPYGWDPDRRKHLSLSQNKHPFFTFLFPERILLPRLSITVVRADHISPIVICRQC